jgi:tRNA (mo5U34)-methyltransferase
VLDQHNKQLERSGGADRPASHAESLRARVEAFPRWHYEIDLGHGVKTPIHDRSKVNRHLQRKRFFFDSMLESLGGDLRGKRVLDLGCNAGFWSLACLDAGCDFICAIDGRRMHIDQARLVLSERGHAEDRFTLICRDLFECDLSTHGPFDIVLCLGLLYHVSKPVELIERICALQPELVVVDTSVNDLKTPAYSLKNESLDDPRNAVDRELVMVPSESAVPMTFRPFGYDCTTLLPDFTDYTGAEDYKKHRRLAFHCRPQRHKGLG